MGGTLRPSYRNPRTSMSDDALGPQHRSSATPSSSHDYARPPAAASAMDPSATPWSPPENASSAWQQHVQLQYRLLSTVQYFVRSDHTVLTVDGKRKGTHISTHVGYEREVPAVGRYESRKCAHRTAQRSYKLHDKAMVRGGGRRRALSALGRFWLSDVDSGALPCLF